MAHTVWIYTAPLEGEEDPSAAARRLLAAGWAELEPGRDLPPLSAAPGGKPDFAAAGWHLSLSHGRTMAAAALCRLPVGVDVETLRPVHPRLFRRVLAEKERAWLEQAPDRDAAFLQLWTLKEAFAKYTGAGLHGLPRDLCFVPEGRTARLQGCPELAAGTELLQGCVLSWCTGAPAVCRLRTCTPAEQEKGGTAG